jgi:hypothetical protein
MLTEFVGGLCSLSWALPEMFFPGWNGYVAEPSDISADAQRIDDGNLHGERRHSVWRRVEESALNGAEMTTTKAKNACYRLQ